ncbi:MAG: GtrA family protein [Frankia sp.]
MVSNETESRGAQLRRKAARFHEVAKFGTVGGLCYIIDVVVFNVCHGVLHTGPLTAKTISTVVAGSCAYVGNRHWSFTHRARTGVRREYSLFIVLNGIGLGIALACLGFSKYVLGMDSTLAVNISGNVIGTGLATIFRFWAYKRFVFLHHDHPKVVGAVAAAAEVSAELDAEDEARAAGPTRPSPNGYREHDGSLAGSATTPVAPGSATAPTAGGSPTAPAAAGSATPARGLTRLRSPQHAPNAASTVRTRSTTRR